MNTDNIFMLLNNIGNCINNLFTDLEEIIVVPQNNLNEINKNFNEREIKEIYNFANSINLKNICNQYSCITIYGELGSMIIYKYINFYHIEIKINDLHEEKRVKFLSDIFDLIIYFNIYSSIKY